MYVCEECGYEGVVAPMSDVDNDAAVCRDCAGEAFGRPARLHRYTFGGMVVAALWEAAS